MIAIVNLDDITNCPKGTSCYNCGSVDDLRVVTFTAVNLAAAPDGVFCATLCTLCRLDPEIGHIAAFALGWAGIAYFVSSHCCHLGITHDEMRAVLHVEQPH